MKIKCPDCSTSYEIKAEAVGAEGRSVKCSKCGNRWFVSPEDDDVGDVDFSAAADTAEDDPVAAADDTDKDEADWAADAEDDDPPSADAEDDDADEEPDDFPPEPASSRASRDENKYASDLEDDDDGPVDIESSAKRPKIIVNPNKFRRNHIGALLNWLIRRNYRDRKSVV